MARTRGKEKKEAETLQLGADSDVVRTSTYVKSEKYVKRTTLTLTDDTFLSLTKGNHNPLARTIIRKHGLRFSCLHSIAQHNIA